MKIDTKDIAPHAWGRFVFRFNWADKDRCTITYTARVHGRDIKIKDSATHSLLGALRENWSSGKIYPHDPAIRYF